MQQVQDSFVRGNTAADAEYQYGDDQRPEIKLLAMAQWMIVVRRLLALLDPQKQ